MKASDLFVRQFEEEGVECPVGYPVNFEVLSNKLGDPVCELHDEA